MRCPECRIECRVEATKNTLRFFCRNKKCPSFGKEVGTKEVKKSE